MLDLGEGVEADPAEAVEWFRRSAAQGSARALNSLAVMHATGRGVPIDYSEARRLYIQSARIGEPHGFYGVAALHANGQGVERDMAEAMAWMLVAAALGDEPAREAVGQVELGAAASRRAVQRGNAILREFGIADRRIQPSELGGKSRPGA